MNGGEKKLLLVWWYTRKDLTEPLIRISEGFSITALYFNSKKDEGHFNNPHSLKILYWSDFTTPHSILKEADASLIIFMGIDSVKTVALRIAAAQRNIPAVVIEHGIKNDLTWIHRIFLDQTNSSRFFLKKFFTKGLDMLRTFRFVLNVFRISNPALFFKLLQLMVAMMRWPVEIALKHSKFSERLADKYFLFAPFQLHWYAERDGVSNDRAVMVGSIFFDDFFEKYHVAGGQPPIIAKRYALVIDQPLDEMSTGDRFELYKNLDVRLQQSGLHMVIKLHPDDYERDEVKSYIREMTHVSWLKNTDIVNIVYYSECCFGFYSTLLIPIICFKATYVFDFFRLPMIEHWIQMKVVTPVYNNDLSDLKMVNMGVSLQPKEYYIKEYLCSTDGKAIDRLRGALKELKL